MSRKHLILIMGFIIQLSYAQSWQWVRTETQALGAGTSVCTDIYGNVYFYGGIFGQTVIGSYSLNAQGGSSCLIKYDSNGNLIWVRTFEINSGTAYGVASDNSGNIFITGSYNGGMTVGSYTFNTNGTSDNIFLIKYDNAGNVLWANSFGGNNYDYSRSVCVDNAGNSIITGYFLSSTLAIGSYTLTNSGNNTLYTAKFDVNGNVLWASSVTNNTVTQSWSVDTDNNNNIFITGAFAGTMVMGNFTLSSLGAVDYFVAKYSPNGAVIWATSGGGTLIDYTRGVSVDPTGNVHIVGSFSSGSILSGTVNLNNSGQYDAFISKYDNSGNFLWAKKAGGPQNDFGGSVSSNSAGGYFIGAYSSNTIQVGGTILNTPANSDAMYLANFDPAGNIINASSLFAGGGAIYSEGLCNVYLVHRLA